MRDKLLAVLRIALFAAFIVTALPLWACRSSHPPDTKEANYSEAMQRAKLERERVAESMTPPEVLEAWYRELPPTKPTVTYNIKLDHPIAVGAIRVDGILVPFATFDGRAWRNHWPETQYGQNIRTLGRIPIATLPQHWWGGHPPVLRWWVLRRAALSTPVAVTGGSFVESLCGVSPALSTDFVSGVPFRHRNAGLFLDGGAPPAGVASSSASIASPIDRVEAGSSDFPPVHRLLVELFAKLEPGVWPGRTIPETAKAPRVTGLYASNLPDGVRLFAFRAERPLPFGRTALVGWIRQDSSLKATVTSVRAFEADPDGKGEMVLHPEGMITLEGRTFWFGRGSGYEASTYVVLDVTEREPAMVLKVDAGMC